MCDHLYYSVHVFRSLVIPETLALETTRYLNAELQFNSWNVALKHLLYADKIFQNYAWYPTYQVFDAFSHSTTTEHMHCFDTLTSRSIQAKLSDVCVSKAPTVQLYYAQMIGQTYHSTILCHLIIVTLNTPIVACSTTNLRPDQQITLPRLFKFLEGHSIIMLSLVFFCLLICYSVSLSIVQYRPTPDCRLMLPCQLRIRVMHAFSSLVCRMSTNVFIYFF